MKLHVGACGIGYGHVGRDLPSVTELAREGWEVYFTTYGEAVNFARVSGYRVYEEPSVHYITKKGEVTMKGTILSFPRQLNSFFKQLVQEYKIIRKEKPDLILSDSRLSTLLAAKLARKRSVLLIHELKVLIPIRNPSFKKFSEEISYRFLSSFWSLADKVVISDFPPPLTIAEDNVKLWWPLRKKSKCVFAGPCGRKSYFKGDKGGVVYMRVSGLESERTILNDIYYKTGLLLAESGVSTVMSRGNVKDESASLFEGGKFVVYGWINSSENLNVKLLVSVAGQTSISEFIDLGIPFVLTPPRSHTEHWGIARSLSKKGIAVSLSLNSLTPESLKEVIQGALNNERLYEAASDFSNIVRTYPGDPILLAVLKGEAPHKLKA
ncbi:MAG: glycosyltransferase [Thermoprotei archaeon]